MTLVTLLILGLAAWRIASFLVVEDGPRDISGKFRYFIGVRHSEKDAVPYGTNIAAQAFTCVWCLSFWISLFVVFIYYFMGGFLIIQGVALILALNTIVILLDSLINRLVE